MLAATWVFAPPAKPVQLVKVLAFRMVCPCVAISAGVVPAGAFQVQVCECRVKGSTAWAIWSLTCPSYLLALARRTVFPDEVSLYASPIRGTIVFQLGRSDTGARVLAPTQVPAPELWAGSEATSISKRTPALTVRRPSVQESCAK